MRANESRTGVHRVSFDLDPITRSRLAYGREFWRRRGQRITQSQILRRALSLYVEHLDQLGQQERDGAQDARLEVRGEIQDLKRSKEDRRATWGPEALPPGLVDDYALPDELPTFADLQQLHRPPVSWGKPPGRKRWVTRGH